LSEHQKYMQRCLQLAKNGLGTTRPNPSVGCVIVYNNRIIGEGYTSPYGGAHAEVNAINSVSDKSLLKSATLYVTLEPCSHHGKTPPCSDLIIKHQIPRVVIGTVDTHDKVSGKGKKKLESAGCNVTTTILEDTCKQQHKRFLTYHNKKRPYIILKWAESQDGFLAPKTKDRKKPVWITNKYSRQLVHKWRAEEHAILVGTNTVIEDNPSLTTRDYKGLNPIRVVIDRTQKLSNSYSVFDTQAETITLSEDNLDFNKPLAQEICSFLHQKNIQSLIVEGGLQTLQTFIDENLWDEAKVFKGSLNFKQGIKAPKFSGELASEEIIQDDILQTFKKSESS